MPENNVRSKIELVPRLDACVETQAKRLYNQTLSELLKKSDDAQLQELLETLRLFLQSADFPGLRAESERYLITGRAVRFFVWQENGALKHEMRVG